MGNTLKRGLAWFFAGSLVFSGLTNIAAWLFDKNDHSPIAPVIFILLIGGIWCFILYYGKKNAEKIAASKQRTLEIALAAPLAPVRTNQALLKPGEHAYATIEAVLQEEQTVGYSAGTQGVSVRIAKGVTLRTSGTRAMPVKGRVAVAQGELVITDKRVIFAGDKKSFFIANDDLLNTVNYSDGFGFTDGSKTYTLTTDKGQAHTLFAVALHKVLRG